MSDLSVYLFETKSIQSFLERTGRLNDMILLSDELDALIDNSKSSALCRVLNAAGLTSNLLDSVDGQDSDSSDILDRNDIVFFRCKGGSLNCLSKDPVKLKSFRSLWTLYFQQAFPTMEYTDYLESGISYENFSSEIGKVFTKLASTYNRHAQVLPIASTVCQSSAYSGLVAVRTESNKNIKRENDIVSVRIVDDEDIGLAIYDKFSKNSTEKNRKIRNFFRKYSTSKSESRDIALVHLDGNSIGITLNIIRKFLKEKNADAKLYIDVMLEFSEKLAKCTAESAAFAIKNVEKNNDYFSDNNYLLYRPLILGGDDLTLFIDPAFAVQFCKDYCTKFEETTQLALIELDNKYQIHFPKTLKFLTASGGILFNKINHPFNNSLSFVSELAEKAKELTKMDVDGIKKLVGPSAVSFYRMSATSTEDFDDVFERSRIYQITIKGKKASMVTGAPAYYLKNSNDSKVSSCSLIDLLNIALNVTTSNTEQSRLYGRLRRMTTEIARNNIEEANSIYEHIVSHSSIETLNKIFSKEAGYSPLDDKNKKQNWYKVDENDSNIYKTIIDDLLVLVHYATLKPIDTSSSADSSKGE